MNFLIHDISLTRIRNEFANNSVESHINISNLPSEIEKQAGSQFYLRTKQCTSTRQLNIDRM